MLHFNRFVALTILQMKSTKKFIKPFEIYMKIFFDKHFCVDFIGKKPIFLNRTINFKIYQPKKNFKPSISSQLINFSS